jgi:serine/threonine protein kinase
MASDAQPTDGGELNLEPGRLIQDRYRIESTLGAGGFAQVFEARDEHLGRRVAVKFLRLDIEGGSRETSREKLLTRFRSEAQITAQLDHPNVIDIFDFGILEVGGGIPFIVMKLLSGRSLREQLDREGAFEPEHALELLTPCLEGLGRAHDEGVVHKDLTPNNLFLTGVGTRAEALQIFDFGIAHIKSHHGTTRFTAGDKVIGTMRYLPPEYLDAQRITKPFDVYQTGLILVEMLTGEALVSDPSQKRCVMMHLSGVRSHIPDVLMRGRLGDTLARALALEPEDRFEDAYAFADALDELRAEDLPETSRIAEASGEREIPLEETQPSDEAFVDDDSTEPAPSASNSAPNTDGAPAAGGARRSEVGESAPRPTRVESSGPASPPEPEPSTPGSEPPVVDDSAPTRRMDSPDTGDEEEIRSTVQLADVDSADEVSLDTSGPERHEQRANVDDEQPTSPSNLDEEDETPFYRRTPVLVLGAGATCLVAIVLVAGTIFGGASAPDSTPSAQTTSAEPEETERVASNDERESRAPTASTDALDETDDAPRSVEIRTTPEGARIVQAGRTLGESPTTVRIASDAGRETFVFEHEGYTSKRVQIGPSDAPTVEVAMASSDDEARDDDSTAPSGTADEAAIETTASGGPSERGGGRDGARDRTGGSRTGESRSNEPPETDSETANDSSPDDGPTTAGVESSGDESAPSSPEGEDTEESPSSTSDDETTSASSDKGPEESSKGNDEPTETEGSKASDDEETKESSKGESPTETDDSKTSDDGDDGRMMIAP